MASTTANGQAVDSTIAAGAFIVNMGVTPQTFGNGLKPYGMIYDLTENYSVPVLWCIKNGKAKDGTDFTYNGVDYKGGTFIIESDYRTSTVNSRISYWQGQGVVGVTTTSPVVVPVRTVVMGYPKNMVNDDNSNIVSGYFSNAGIPTSAFTIGLPSALGICEDAYLLPHSDPTWLSHGAYLYDWVKNNKGYVWAGCHSISVFENLSNPADTSQKTNFLTTKGLQCYGNGNCGPNVTETHAGAPTLPYSDGSPYATDLVMQYMGDMGPATNGGSERWYIPLSNSTWRPTTTTAITTADGSGSAKGAVLAYGRGFGNENYGRVMYEAGHALNNGTVANRTAAQRAFFNFILVTGEDKKLNLTANIPTSIGANQTVAVSVTASGGNGPYTYQWTTNTGGTFASPTNASTNLTMGNQAAKGTITIRVTDVCGRSNFITRVVNPNGYFLPVELLSLEAMAVESAVVVRWTTMTELNCSHFHVERSNGASDWQFVGMVPASATSLMHNTYSIEDPSPHDGHSYYRVIEHGLDGSSKVLGVDQVFIDLPGVVISAMPNPTDGELFLSLASPRDETLTLSIDNLMGQRVFETSLFLDANETVLLKVPEELQFGMYFVSWMAGNASGAIEVLARR